MRIHKTKYNKVVEMLKQGYSYKQIAKEVGVSISQITEVAKIYDLYIETNEIREKIEKIKKSKEKELRNLQNLTKIIESLKLEIRNLEKRKQSLQNEIRNLESKWTETRLKVREVLRKVKWEVVKASLYIPIDLPKETRKSIKEKLDNLEKIVVNLLNQLEQSQTKFL